MTDQAVEAALLAMFAQGPLTRKLAYHSDELDRASTNQITQALIRLKDAGTITHDTHSSTWVLVNTDPATSWTTEEIRRAMIDELTASKYRAEVWLDWWARDKGIPTCDVFNTLSSSPEFVYREWTEGQGNWVWTLRGQCEPEKTDDDKLDYATGASRSSEGEETRFELISPIALGWVCDAAADPMCGLAVMEESGEPRLLIAAAMDGIYSFLSGGDADYPDQKWIKGLAYAALLALKAAHIERGGDPRFAERSPAWTKEVHELGVPRFDLLPPRGLIAVAETYREGADKRGRHNWEYGMCVHDMLNRSLRHFVMWLDKDRSDPHLGHGIWGILGSIHSLVMWPDLNRGKLRKKGCLAPFLTTPELPSQTKEERQ